MRSLTTFILLFAGSAHASLPAKVVQEAAEHVLRKFGKEATQLGAGRLARRIEAVGAHHGDTAIAAVKRTGPAGLRAIEQAGAHAPQTAALLARHGTEALWVTASKGRMAFFTRLGDDAALAMMRHPGVAQPLLKTMGQPAAQAMKGLSKRSGRRLGIMAESGALAGMGRSREVLAVVARFGDRGLAFIWKHKGALAVGTVLAAFLADPQPFIDGTRRLVGSVGSAVAGGALDAAKGTLQTLLARLDWRVIPAAVLPLGALLLLGRRRRRPTSAC